MLQSLSVTLINDKAIINISLKPNDVNKKRIIVENISVLQKTHMVV